MPDTDIIKELQQDLTLGERVSIALVTGEKIEGILQGISLSLITIKNNNGETEKYRLQMIGGWKTLENANKEQHENVVTESHRNLAAKEKQGDKDVIDEDIKPTIPQPAAAQGLQKKALEPVEIDMPEPTIPPELERQLWKVEVVFEEKIKQASLPIREPDFPKKFAQELQNRDFQLRWHRLEEKYRYARSVNELSRKFGRLTEIIHQLQKLRSRFQAIPGISSRIAYLHSLQGDYEEALTELRRETVLFPDDLDEFTLLNSAAIALQADSGLHALYFLSLFFKTHGAGHDAWYIFLGLLISTENVGLLSQVAVPETPEELKIVMESVAYILLKKEKPAAAALFLQSGQDNGGIDDRLKGLFPTSLSNAYKEACQLYSVQELEETENAEVVSQQQGPNPTFAGTIKKFFLDRGFGFVRPLVSGGDVFFHISAVVDEELRANLLAWPKAQGTKVLFKHGVGNTGDTVAIELKGSRSVQELYKLAKRYSDKGDYLSAISYIKQLLEKDPGNTKAVALHESLKKYAISQHLPRGSNPYAKAKRAELAEQDLETAVKLYRKAINSNDNRESAVKDLAMLLTRLERTDEAVKLLEQYRAEATDKLKIDHVLTALYEKANNIDGLHRILAETEARKEKELLLWKIGNIYIKTDRFEKAEQIYKEILKHSPDNIGAKKNLAYTLFRQDHFDEAEQLLTRTMAVSMDNSVAALLQTIQQVKQTGEEIDFSVVELELTADTSYISTSGAITEFMRFFLNRQSLSGLVPAERLNEGNYSAINEGDIDYDLRMAEQYAKSAQTRRPETRAKHFFQAAKIIFETEGDLQQLYKFMYRAFVSLGDNAIENNLPLDTARQFYQESVALFGRLSDIPVHEQDINNAIVRYLWSTLGSKAAIPMNTRRMPSIRAAVESLITKHPEPVNIFDILQPLIFSCEFAESQILGKIFSNHTFRNAALSFFTRYDLGLAQEDVTRKTFTERWSRLKKLYWKNHRQILTTLRAVRKVELTRLSIDDNLDKLKQVGENPQLIDLDQERIQRLISIINLLSTILEANSYEIQSHRVNDSRHEGNNLLKEIEASPTRLSIEEIYPILLTILSKLSDYEDALYDKSKPQIGMRLPEDFDTLIPDNFSLDVQVVIENSKGRSPAENLALHIGQDQDKPLFSAEKGRYPYAKDVLRGGSQDIILLPLQLTPGAVKAGAFSFTVWAEYKTVRGEVETTQPQTFQINLRTSEEFIEIDDPYEAGSVVQNPEMVYGRDELIDMIVRELQKVKQAGTGKSFVIYGQKRTGKSTVLDSIGRKLQEDPDNIVVDIGSVGQFLGNTDIYHRFLWKILSKFRQDIHKFVRSGLPELDIDFPRTNDNFLSRKSPDATFIDIFDLFLERKDEFEEWKNKRVILLVDEFTYFFRYIREKKVSSDLLKTWKAFLQANYYNAVLIGQDFMLKFIKEFENEFAAMKAEKITYLQEEDAKLLIDEPIRIGGKDGKSRYRENAMQRIFDLTAGNPYYIQMFCKKLVAYLNEKKASLITEAYVEDVKNRLIDSVELGTFDNLYNSEDLSEYAVSKEDSINVLKQIAENSRTGPCPRSAIVVETDAPVDRILTDLLERDVLERDKERENYYHIKVLLFRDFLLTRGI